MDSSYRVARLLCGLSILEASAFHGVDVETIDQWDDNDTPASRAAWMDLCSLFRQISEIADKEAAIAATGEISPAFHRSCPEIDAAHDPLPYAGARKAAGAMALMRALTLKMDGFSGEKIGGGGRLMAGTSCA